MPWIWPPVVSIGPWLIHSTVPDWFTSNVLAPVSTLTRPLVTRLAGFITMTGASTLMLPLPDFTWVLTVMDWPAPLACSVTAPDPLALIPMLSAGAVPSLMVMPPLVVRKMMLPLPDVIRSLWSAPSCTGEVVPLASTRLNAT